MPTPNATHVAGIRARNLARALFMRLEHSQGTLRYWTGLGPFTFGGETYHGIAGLARVSGVSDSADVQQHDVAVSLNAVPLSALTDVDQSIRGRSADMWAAWIDVDGTVVHSIRVFSGKGNRLVIKPGDTEYAIEARLKANLANWLSRGDRFFTNVDQQRAFPGDTGFGLVPALQNATLTGWQRTGAAATDLVYLASNFGGAFQHLADAAGVIMGLEDYGPYFYTSAGRLLALDSAWQLTEDALGNFATWTSAGQPITCAGANVSIDGSGFAQSINGNMIRSSTGSKRVRRQGTISGNGTAGVNPVTFNTISGINYLRRTGGAASSGDYSGLVYCENPAYRVSLGTVYSAPIASTTPTNVQDVQFHTNTGAFAGRGVPQGIGDNPAYKWVYSALLGQVTLAVLSGSVYAPNAVNISSTGVMVANLSGTLYRCIPANGDTTSFARIWT